MIITNNGGCFFLRLVEMSFHRLQSQSVVTRRRFVDLYTSRGRKFIFHPELLLGLSGKFWQTSSQSLLGGSVRKKKKKTSLHFQNGSTFAGCFSVLFLYFFFLPAFTEGGRKKKSFQRDVFYFFVRLNAATCLLQNVFSPEPQPSPHRQTDR